MRSMSKLEEMPSTIAPVVAAIRKRIGMIQTFAIHASAEVEKSFELPFPASLVQESLIGKEPPMKMSLLQQLASLRNMNLGHVIETLDTFTESVAALNIEIAIDPVRAFTEKALNHLDRLDALRIEAGYSITTVVPDHRPVTLPPPLPAPVADSVPVQWDSLSAVDQDAGESKWSGLLVSGRSIDKEDHLEVQELTDLFNALDKIGEMEMPDSNKSSEFVTSLAPRKAEKQVVALGEEPISAMHAKLGAGECSEQGPSAPAAVLPAIQSRVNARVSAPVGCWTNPDMDSEVDASHVAIARGSAPVGRWTHPDMDSEVDASDVAIPESELQRTYREVVAATENESQDNVDLIDLKSPQKALIDLQTPKAGLENVQEAII
jgi:hypothetical protein